METTQNERIYLNVPFSEKEEAKAIGAKWDNEKKSWYVLADVSEEAFVKWIEELEKVVPEETEFQCEECGSMLLKRPTKNGTSWFSCSAYPKCEIKYWATSDEKPKFEEKEV